MEKFQIRRLLRGGKMAARGPHMADAGHLRGLQELCTSEELIGILAQNAAMKMSLFLQLTESKCLNASSNCLRMYLEYNYGPNAARGSQVWLPCCKKISRVSFSYHSNPTISPFHYREFSLILIRSFFAFRFSN